MKIKTAILASTLLATAATLAPAQAQDAGLTEADVRAFFEP